MELDGVFWLEGGTSEDAEGFENCDNAGAVVVCAGPASGGGAACRVIEGSYDDCLKVSESGQIPKCGWKTYQDLSLCLEFWR